MSNRRSHEEPCLHVPNLRAFSEWFTEESYEKPLTNYYDKEKFWDLFRDERLCFHATQFNPKNLVKILKRWILSAQEAEFRWVKIKKEHPWFNQNKYISVSRSPTVFLESVRKRRDMYSSFEWYSLGKGNMSFVMEMEDLDTVSQKSATTTYWISEFYDEVFVKGRIPHRSIRWVIIDREVLGKKTRVNGKILPMTEFLKSIVQKYHIQLYDKKGFEIEL